MMPDILGRSDGERLVTEYRRARLRLSSLLVDVDAPTAARAVPACPAWTVADLVAHLAGLADGYGTGRVPDADRQQWLDGLVTERRGRPVADVVAEWNRAGPSMEQAIADQPGRRWPLVYDVIAHEHDLRGALGHVGDRDDAAVWLGLELGLRITTGDLARHDLPGITVVADGVELLAGDPPTGLTLRATAFEAFRLLGSRRTWEEMGSAVVTGDLDRFLPGLVHMRLPDRSLGEDSAPRSRSTVDDVPR